MKKLGYLLITIGFLGGAFICVVDKLAVKWTHYAPFLIIGLVGVVMARRSLGAAGQTQEMVEENISSLKTSLDKIVELAAKINQEKASMDVYDVRHRIDELFRDDIEIFVNHRELIASRYGLQSYADMMSHFAAGERYLNRSWSASTDGYIDEVHASLSKMQEHFGETKALLEKVQAA